MRLKVWHGEEKRELKRKGVSARKKSKSKEPMESLEEENN